VTTHWKKESAVGGDGEVIATVVPQHQRSGESDTQRQQRGRIAGATNAITRNVACSTNTLFNRTASDPLATQQWHLKNTRQNAFADSGGVAGHGFNVDPYYDFGFTGSV